MQFMKRVGGHIPLARAIGLSLIFLVSAAHANTKKREAQPQARQVQQQRPVRVVQPARTLAPSVVQRSITAISRHSAATRLPNSPVTAARVRTGVLHAAGTAPHRVQSGHTYTRNGQTLAAFHADRYRWPHGVRYHRYAAGTRLPHRFWLHDYYITDYALYDLDAPPPDFVWVRYGPDLLELDTTTGEIAQVLYGFFDDAPEAVPPAPSGPDLSAFVGVWRNADSETRGITGIEVSQAGDGFTLHVYGKCHPTDCDWGTVSASPQDAGGQPAIAGAYVNGFSQRIVSVQQAGDGSLSFQITTHFTDNSGRPDHTMSGVLVHS